jgi:hypothetical protein
MLARHSTHGTAASVGPLRLRSLPLLLLLTATSSASPDAWAEALRGSSDPAIKWFANERDIPCAPGWGGFLCNEKLLPLGEVPLPLPPPEQVSSQRPSISACHADFPASQRLSAPLAAR